MIWIPAGAPAKVPDGGLRIPGDDWQLIDKVNTRDQVCLARPGRPYSIYVFWDHDGRLSHWYVNFERPLRRSPRRLRLVDEKLDLIVPSGRPVRLEGRGRARPGRGSSASSTGRGSRGGERVLEEWPFPTGWEDLPPGSELADPEVPGRLGPRLTARRDVSQGQTLGHVPFRRAYAPSSAAAGASARCLPGTASAITAPTPTTAAPTHIAVTMPS